MPSHTRCVAQLQTAYAPISRPSRTLAAAVSAAITCLPVTTLAQEQGFRAPEEVIVTATRRSESVQDVPLNIAAIGEDELRQRGVTDLAEISRAVPGLFVIDQGARAANAIVVRGLNANPISGTEALGNDSGRTVATYVGEIPVYLDLKPDDLERVEVLLGPQGTLYGAGTLGGAIRYIPKRPQFDKNSLQVRGRGYGLAESDGFGTEAGFTANFSASETLALRTTVSFLDDPGFIDHNYLVREPGISDPEPDFNNPADMAANLWRREDADDEQTWSGRIALRANPIEALDINLTYYFQDQEVGGRSGNHRLAFGTGKYEAAHRYLEPNDRRNELLALEITADLGFAELTSASGASRYKERGGRDQTDLLITLEYSYEAFPSFSAFTRERQEDERLNQELRLVSTGNSQLSWIAGAFFNRLDRKAESREFTPQFGEYVTGGGIPGVDFRADALEFLDADDIDQEEFALYGELRYEFTDRWQATAGARWYEYEVETFNAVLIPLFDPAATVAFGDPSVMKDSGSLFKFNTSYQFTDDLMVYATISEGYRFGDSNALSLCDPNNTSQQGCGQPDELEYKADTTTNYEVGLRSEWLDKRLLLNASVYYMDWEDPQLASTTDNAGLPIFRNGKGAKSQGLELTFAAQLTDQLSLRGSYAYTQAELTADAPSLLNTIVPPGFNSTRVDIDGRNGDRLPGSPEHQGSFWTSYEMPLSAGLGLDLNYGVAAQGDVLTKTGARADGEVLGGFAIHYASAVLKADDWTLGLYVKNLFNKYAITGVRSTRASNQSVTDENGARVLVRSYMQDVLRPREIGLRFNYNFEL